MLARLGALLREHARETDLAARLGGEEFALILPATTKADTGAFLRRLRERLHDTEILLDDGRGLRITASMGYTIANDRELATGAERQGAGPSSSQEILRRADEALYWVKRNGRDAVMAWDDLNLARRSLMTGQKAKPKHQSTKPAHSLIKATLGVTTNSHQTFPGEKCTA
ncbi:putative diguanylate cyclase YedQ [Thiorhodovibrio winogradskyi]|uniref:diguanylate cyclase n=1 Tax=Thiorhodovibrio winogradskyi TaxID=77007 RepID=A0ABZ0S853_9GAMM|nr:GGDEF domain-containing protein [Thiorhodovibrio winogradskyi]